MALSNEDHKDVKGALGKAMANKIRKVTRDGDTKPVMPKTVGYNKRGVPYTAEAAKHLAQDREDAATEKMTKRYSEKSRGARMTRSFLG